MRGPSHRWCRGSDLPVIEAHSLVKHDILYDYIFNYVIATTRNFNMPRLSLTIVDGFAGGNIYQHWKTRKEQEGSPSIILRAICDAEEEVRRERRKNFSIDCHFVFIEIDAEAFWFLQETIRSDARYGARSNWITLLNNDFCSCLNNIIIDILSRSRLGRSIFILDQCGYAAVEIQKIKQLLSTLEKSEVFLTFATDFLLDYLRKDEEKSHFIECLNAYIPVRLNDTPGFRVESRRALQYALHEELKAVAPYYTPFFIYSEESHRDLWLIHYSQNYKARDVMVQQHWKHHNSSAHYGTSGYKMLGYEPGNDSKITRQLILDGYMFDEAARKCTSESLYEDLPMLLREEFPGGTDLRSLYSTISNETPATVELLEEVLRDLLADRVIDVRDPTGKTKRTADVKLGDIIKAGRQIRIFH
jgi:three-Cys-motif partner protein